MSTGLTLRTVLLKIQREKRDPAEIYDALDKLTNLYSRIDPPATGGLPVSIDDITRAGIRIHKQPED